MPCPGAKFLGALIRAATNQRYGGAMDALNALANCDWRANQIGEFLQADVSAKWASKNSRTRRNCQGASPFARSCADVSSGRTEAP